MVLVKLTQWARRRESSGRGAAEGKRALRLRSRRTRRALWAWIAFSVVLLAHALVVGGGIAEPILLWQLRRFQSVDEGTTILGLLALLTGIPGLILTFVTPRNRNPSPLYDAARKRWTLIISGACIIVTGALGSAAVAPVLSRPTPRDSVQQMTLDERTGDERIGQIRAVLVGVPRPEYGLNYDQVSRGWKYGGETSTRRTLLPITAANWTPARPVDFIMDTRGRDWHDMMRQTASGEWMTRPGYLLRWQLSDLERHVLVDQGLVLGDDVMVYSTDRLSGTEGLVAFAAICGCVSFVLLLGFVVSACTSARPTVK